MKSQKSALQQYLDTNSRSFSRAPGPLYHNPAGPQSWETQFPNSKMQCMNQLQKIKQRLRGSQQSIKHHLKDHQNLVLRQLDQEYQSLRNQILRQMDRVYQQNKLKVKIGFQSNGLGDINDLFKEFRTLQLKIQQLMRQLQTSSTYKKGIAGTVLEDFQNKRRLLMARTTQAINKYENEDFLRVDMNVFAQIKQNINNLFICKGGRQDSNIPKGFGSFGPQNTFGFTSTANFKDLQNIQLQNQESPGIFVVPPTGEFPNSFPIRQENTQMQRLSSPNFLMSGPIQNQGQPFSFQPSQASQRQRHLFQSPLEHPQALRQSSAQQFRNSYSRQFDSQFNIQSGFMQSQVYPFTKRQIPLASNSSINPHRNRDLIKKQI